MALWEALPQLKAKEGGTYTFEQEKIDFLTVFDSEAGRRVLSRISQVCDPSPIGPHDVEHTHKMAFMAGQRWVWLEITRCMAGRGASQHNEEQNG